MRHDYWFGPDEEDRRKVYAKEFRPEYQQNGDDTQRRITAVLTPFRAETQVELPEGYSSGWRPPTVNESTANAAKRSTHLQANAGDKRDSLDAELCWWLLTHPTVLEAHGLWMEHPAATAVRAWVRGQHPWCHLQRTPPLGREDAPRIYWPDSASLREWDEFIAKGGYVGITRAAWVALSAPPSTKKKPKNELPD